MYGILESWNLQSGWIDKILAFNKSLKFKTVKIAWIFTVLSKIISDFYESKLIWWYLFLCVISKPLYECIYECFSSDSSSSINIIAAQLKMALPSSQCHEFSFLSLGLAVIESIRGAIHLYLLPAVMMRQCNNDENCIQS